MNKIIKIAPVLLYVYWDIMVSRHMVQDLLKDRQTDRHTYKYSCMHAPRAHLSLSSSVLLSPLFLSCQGLISENFPQSQRQGGCAEGNC